MNEVLYNGCVCVIFIHDFIDRPRSGMKIFGFCRNSGLRKVGSWIQKSCFGLRPQTSGFCRCSGFQIRPRFHACTFHFQLEWGQITIDLSGREAYFIKYFINPPGANFQRAVILLAKNTIYNDVTLYSWKIYLFQWRPRPSFRHNLRKNSLVLVCIEKVTYLWLISGTFLIGATQARCFRACEFCSGTFRNVYIFGLNFAIKTMKISVQCVLDLQQPFVM